MRRQILPNSPKEEKKRIEATSPDGKWGVYAAGENTILIRKKGGGYWSTYCGHQDGVHHRIHATIQEITWDSASLVRSTSSTGSIHLWQVPQCVHVDTIRPAQARRIA